MHRRTGSDEQFPESAVDAMDHPVVVVSGDGSFCQWNDSAADATGYDDAAFESATFRELFADGDRGNVAAELDRASRQRERATFEAALVTAAGDRVPYEFSLAPLAPDAGDGPSKVVATGRDVSRRAQLRAELSEKTNLVEQIFEQVPINLYVKDEAGRHLWMSNTHHDPEGIIGKTDREFYEGEFGEETYADDVQVVETGEPIHGKKEYNPAEDRWTLTSKAPLYGADGEIAGLVGVTRDISEREAYRRQLKRQNERLERFANVVSHDLRNPLNVASGYFEFVAEECEGDHVDRVASALDRMEQIVEGVLTVAREGRTVEEREPVSLSELSRRCWRNVETGDAELAVERDVAFEADPARVQSVVENLFRNAVEHAGPDVTVRVGRLDEGWYVEDDGPGIPAEDRDAVFEFGYSSREDGTGFGLNIVEQLVEAHGWDVSVTEGPDGGTRFEVTGVEVEAAE